MGNTHNPQAWSTTAADNDDADAGINYKEGQDAASLNNAGRGGMTGVKNYILDTDGGLAAAGSANAITVTTNQSLSSAHVAAGATLTFRATATNTGATTFAPDGLSAVAIVDQWGSALIGGEIRSGAMITLRYNANTSKWVLVTPAVRPAVVFLNSGSVSAASELDIDMSGYSGYRMYEIVITQWRPASAANLYMRFSTDGGSNFDDSASDYNWAVIGTDEDGGTVAGVGDGSVGGGDGSYINLASPNTDNDSRLQGTIRLYDPEAARQTRATFTMGYTDSDSEAEFLMGTALAATAQNTDAVRLYFPSVNIAAGDWALYGYR